MKTEIVQSLTAQFEASAQKTDSGIEFWLARDVQHLLGYSKWENFLNAVSRAKTACEVSGHPIPDHFVEVTKMVDLGSGSQREIDDQMLSRYACYPRAGSARAPNRNTDLDTQLVWRGKDEQDWSDLVVHAPPLYIQEKVHPKALIDELLRESKEREHEQGQVTADLFADFNGIPKDADKTEF